MLMTCRYLCITNPKISVFGDQCGAIDAIYKIFLLHLDVEFPGRQRVK